MQHPSIKWASLPIVLTLTIFILGLSLPSTPLAAAQSSPVRAIPILATVLPKIAAAYPDLGPAEDISDPLYVGLDPTGTRFVVMVNKGLTLYPCVYTLADDAIACFPYEASGRPLPIDEGLAAWSPDGTALVYHSDWARDYQDTDLMLWDIATGAQVVLTEDHYEGVMFPSDATPHSEDYAPFWSPDSQWVYYFSFNAGAEDWQNQLLVQRIPRTGGTPELVADLSGQVPNREFFYPKHVAVSPDGQTAVVVTNSYDLPPQVNLWQVNLATGEAVLWIDHAALYAATIPAWIEDPGLLGQEVLWSADGQTVILTLGYVAARLYSTAYTDLPPLNYALIDVATGTVRGIVDVAQWNDAASFNAQGGFQQFSPRFGLLTPDGQSLIYATFTLPPQPDDSLAVTFWSASLSAAAAPTELATLELPADVRLQGRKLTDRDLTQIAANGLALVQSDHPNSVYLFEFTMQP